MKPDSVLPWGPACLPGCPPGLHSQLLWKPPFFINYEHDGGGGGGRRHWWNRGLSTLDAHRDHKGLSQKLSTSVGTKTSRFSYETLDTGCPPPEEGEAAMGTGPSPSDELPVQDSPYVPQPQLVFLQQMLLRKMEQNGKDEKASNSAPKPSQQMSGTAGQGARGPPTAPSPGTEARLLPRRPICLDDSQLGSVSGKLDTGEAWSRPPAVQ
ncbi:uncharacterized protein LOC116744177 [Phocoena sinus]|uniref:uncharacterized protein LOC116744177 n=1 Tax=Phocoena sinus TaxID=42100 RepID=UPI0013C46CE7|nr:uncharacterized protein LOC116744177 [Phocoena sinus]